MSVLRFTTSGYPFGVFRLYCLSLDLQLLVTPLLYSDCIVCPLIYNFWLPLWYIQTVLSVLLFTTSGYPFGVFRLYCLSFYLQLLVTPLVYSDCIVCPSIYNFWLLLWCIQTVLSVLLFTTSGYPFGVFRLYCLSFDLQLLVTPLVYSDCIVCPSIYNFWLPLWCIQTVLSVLLFTTSGYPFGVFRLYCLSFYLQLLVTPLVYSDCLSLDLQFLVTPLCIQTVLSVLRFTTSGYPFGVFRLYCLSLDLQLLVTPLLYSDCIVCPSIYNFWLPLWCIQTVLSVLRFTTSGYPFGVFRLYCLSLDLQLLVTPLLYSDCIVCPLIYNFWLPLWYIQTVLSVLLFTTSGYPFGVFRLYCLSFYLQLLVTPLVYSDCIVCPSIYNFWLLLWCIQTVLSVLLFTTSGYPFGVFRLYCLSFDLQLLVTPLVYSDCIVCPSIYNFWLPLWCIQTVLSVLLFTTSGYPFGVFRLYCLSFYLQLLVTPLVYSDCIVCPSIYNFWLPL